jgi:4-amino-4-deoxy-L-arabinose transferase-like glycosyltransferase
MDAEEDKKEESEPVKENKNFEKRREKINNWLKNPSNLALLGILIISFIILIYYFNLTRSQPLWWDEAEYMSIASKWAFGIPYEVSPQRPVLFPFFEFLLLKLSLSELLIKFILVLIPAWLCVLLTYLFVKDLYDIKVALIASFITSVSWIHLFYASRLMTDAIGLVFGLLALLFFWKGYIKKQSKYFIWFTGFFIGLSLLIRLTGIMYGAVILIFVLFTDKFKFIKNKDLWIMFGIFLLTIFPLFIWDYTTYSNPLAFRSGYGGPQGSSLGWWMFQLFFDYPELGFFIFFLIGFVALIPFFISLDQIILGKSHERRNDLFIIISIVFTLAFFIYFVRQGENRWLILMSIGIFVLCAKGIILVYDLVHKNVSKTLALIIILILLPFGAYFQLNHTDQIIKGKIDSYQQVKDSGLWLKENSNKTDIIISASNPQHTYYAQRKVLSYPVNESDFSGYISKNNPRYLVVSIFEPSVSQWTYDWPQRHNNTLMPVKVYYLDPQQQQVAMVIYEFNNYNAIY